MTDILMRAFYSSQTSGKNREHSRDLGRALTTTVLNPGHSPLLSGKKTKKPFTVGELMKLETIILIGVCLVIIGVSIPLILEKIGPNAFYGFRTSKTRSSEMIWYKANKYCGYALIYAGIVSILCLLGKVFFPQFIPFSGSAYYGAVVLVVPIAIAVLLSFIYLNKL